MAKQKKRIAEPWISELELKVHDVHCGEYFVMRQKNDIININLINNQTGEIRQKRVTIDQIVRRVFESEIETSKDIELEDIDSDR